MEQTLPDFSVLTNDLPDLPFNDKAHNPNAED